MQSELVRGWLYARVKRVFVYYAMIKNRKGNRLFTAFQLRVWEAALTIPFGQVRTYSWVAGQIGSPKAARAVGSALKKNPYPVIIPCHRVVKSSGDIGEYSRGRKAKWQLIELEKRVKNLFCLNR